MAFASWETGEGDNTPMLSCASAAADVLRSPPLAANISRLLRVILSLVALGPLLIAGLVLTFPWLLSAGTRAAARLVGSASPAGVLVAGVGGSSGGVGLWHGRSSSIGSLTIFFQLVVFPADSSRAFCPAVRAASIACSQYC